MIECCNENIWYIKNKRRFKKKTKFVIFLIIFCLFSVYYKFCVIETVCQYCKNICSSLTNENVNNVVLKSTELYVGYNDLIDIQKNDNGDIILIETNSNLINRISSNLAVSSKKAIDNNLKNGVKIPVLTFLGVKLISGYGKQVNLKILNISEVQYNIESQFEARGINQTVHSVYLNIETKMNLIMPFSDDEIISNTKVLLCESIVVGKIPNIYLEK